MSFPKRYFLTSTEKVFPLMQLFCSSTFISPLYIYINVKCNNNQHPCTGTYSVAYNTIPNYVCVCVCEYHYEFVCFEFQNNLIDLIF